MQIKMARLSHRCARTFLYRRRSARRRDGDPTWRACVEANLGMVEAGEIRIPIWWGVFTSSAAGGRCRRDGTADVQVSQMSVFNCPTQEGSQ